MAGESENQNNEGQSNNEGGNQNASVENITVHNYADTIDSLKEFMSPDTVKEAAELANKMVGIKPAKKTEGSQEEEQQEEQQEENAEEQEESQEEEQQEEEQEEGSENAEGKDTTKKGEKKPEKKDDQNQNQGKKSVLGLNKNKAQKNDLVIENEEQLKAGIKSKFGMDLKNGIKDMPKFFESAQQWRKEAQESGTIKKEYEEFKGLIGVLPAEVIESIKLFHNGEDYMKAFDGKPRFNFTMPVEKQDIKKLVTHYFPNKFKDEDFTDENPSQALEIAKEAAIEKYNTHKTNIETQRATVIQNAAVRTEAVKTSLASSVTSLSEAFPDVEKEPLDEISSILEGGPEKVMAEFYNKDGTVKKDAAIKMMMAKYGIDEIERMMELSANIAESRVNEEIVSRSADRKKPLQTGNKKKEVPVEVQKQVDELRSTIKQNTF